MAEELGGKYRYELTEPGNQRAELLCVISTPPVFEDLCQFVFEQRLA